MPSVDTLEALMKFGTQVVDLRLSDSVKGGIIPGAMSIPYPFWRGPKENPGAPPSDRALSRTIGGAGLKLDRPIVLVSGTAAPFDTGRAAYVYWILKSLGAKQLAILKGGHAAWKASGRPLASTPYRGRQYRVQLKLSDQWRAGQSDVEQIAAGTLKGTLLDARPSQMFAKQTLTQQSVPSTLPGAYNSPAPSAHRLATAEGSYREGAMSVLDGLKTQKVNWSHDTVVSFCNTGELGALNWFYASEVSGIKNVKLYPESATGWKHAGHKLAVPSIDR
ncbi:MAG: rhodanese-like domain-containing protein [Pseudomonadota bacterium]